MRILVVEDKKALANIVAERLEKEGYTVDSVYDGEEGLYCAVSGAYDLIVLDIMLPGLDGFEVLQELQKKNVQSKVIILSARSALSDKLKGLQNGADDYVTKPFHLDELVARVELQLKDKTGSVDGTINFGDLSLDAKSSILKCTSSKEEVELVKKELEILEFLINNKKQIVSKQQIYDNVWGIENEVESNNLEVYLSFIRRKLKAIGSKVNIKASRGLGYKLEYCDEVAKK